MAFLLPSTYFGQIKILTSAKIKPVGAISQERDAGNPEKCAACTHKLTLLYSQHARD